MTDNYIEKMDERTKLRCLHALEHTLAAHPYIWGIKPERRSGKERRKDGLARRVGADPRCGRERRLQPYVTYPGRTK